MKQEINYNEATNAFEIHIVVPKTMRGTYTYGDESDGKWEQDAVCVWISDRTMEYGLFHTQYLDYKDSLQATSPIVYFETKEEALKFAEKHSLMVEYARY